MRNTDKSKDISVQASGSNETHRDDSPLGFILCAIADQLQRAGFREFRRNRGTRKLKSTETRSTSTTTTVTVALVANIALPYRVPVDLVPRSVHSRQVISDL